MVEQWTVNSKVIGSSPVLSDIVMIFILKLKILLQKKVAEWSKVIDCKSIELFYMGSNPILLKLFGFATLVNFFVVIN